MTLDLLLFFLRYQIIDLLFFPLSRQPFLILKSIKRKFNCFFFQQKNPYKASSFKKYIYIIAYLFPEQTDQLHNFFKLSQFYNSVF